MTNIHTCHKDVKGMICKCEGLPIIDPEEEQGDSPNMDYKGFEKLDQSEWFEEQGGWEEEFEKRFNRHGIFKKSTGDSYLKAGGGLSNAYLDEVSFEVKSFIQKALQAKDIQCQQEKIEIVEDAPDTEIDTGEGKTCIFCSEEKGENGFCEPCENWNDHCADVRIWKQNTLKRLINLYPKKA